jgi:2-methylcitrate dehydratase PrpD
MAEFVSGLTYESVPAEVLQRLKLLMLDSVGCALYGSDLPWTRILQQTLAEHDSSQSCAIWGTGLRLSAPHAALVNGTQVQGFELDDVHRQGVMHVGAVVLPALIAIAETRPGMHGKDFLAAAVAGYETGPRVGICMGQEHIAQGWHSGATLGVFSAAAAAARGLKLDVDKTVHALGIAGTQSSGLMAAQYGAMVKRMHAGRGPCRRCIHAAHPPMRQRREDGRGVQGACDFGQVVNVLGASVNLAHRAFVVGQGAGGCSAHANASSVTRAWPWVSSQKRCSKLPSTWRR